MPVNEYIAPSKIFDTASYLNAIHSTNIAIWEHFAGMLFNGDNSRIVYAPTDFAFRARQKVTNTSNLELPFMNFRIEALENNNERRWWNQYAQARGMYSLSGFPHQGVGNSFQPFALITIFVPLRG